MVPDKQLEFSDAQAETTVDTHVSTNVVDLGTARNIARGRDLTFISRVQTPVTSAGAATVQIRLVESAAADLSNPTVLLDSGAVALASMVAGYTMLKGKVPKTSKRYLGVEIIIGIAVLTAGKFDNFLVLDDQDGNDLPAQG